ncbi:alpha/beta fold hydrolase [Mycobacterium sp. NPDC048908]|uniref:alpha/beta fold hydrolase n=1 Tax=Mycobacterium sp. NPDC048908 TaxID=3364292 RepID=UPI0037245A2D
MTVATTVADGILTRYQVSGTGPPLLMFSPGGFNASLDSWEAHGLYQRTRMLAQLRERFTCITFDKREAGGSGGRLERVRWAHYVSQGIGLLDHLGHRRVHIMGACVGCSIATLFAATHPDRVAGMVLYSPAGGPQYRRKQHARFTAHLAYVAEHGLAGVAALAAATEAGFSDDGRVGPWVSVLRSDPDFAARYVEFDAVRYQTIVAGMSRLLFDRDTVPGAEPEDLLALDVPALIVPGEDSSHAPSAAHYLKECLPAAQYWDVPVAEQTVETAPKRVIDFLASLAF